MKILVQDDFTTHVKVTLACQFGSLSKGNSAEIQGIAQFFLLAQDLLQ